jgi:cellulose synthase/poly-beta-1,6-N-acetylglucosamine synthase-like glycosyltransferase
MTLYFITVFGFYLLLLLAFRVGWSRSVKKQTVIPGPHRPFLSVVVALRNEEQNLKRLSSCLAAQKYPSDHFEVILVDDHSTDISFRLAGELMGGIHHRRLISLPAGETGKKAALAKGIALAKGEIIVTTDADCSPPEHWLATLGDAFRNEKTKMVLGTVVVEGGKDFFSRWQTLEFASVIGTGVATFGLGIPTMANGANLSFRKETYDEVDGYRGNEHIASGDDEFLMKKIQKKYSNGLTVLVNQKALVSTLPQPSVNEFIRQRLRWAGKWKVNSSVVSRSLAVFIFGVQLTWLALWASLLMPGYLVTGAAIAVGKVAADLLFLLPVFTYLKINVRIIPFLGLQFFYPFYVVFIGLFSSWKGVTWKGRPIT